MHICAHLILIEIELTSTRIKWNLNVLSVDHRRYYIVVIMVLFDPLTLVFFAVRIFSLSDYVNSRSVVF